MLGKSLCQYTISTLCGWQTYGSMTLGKLCSTSSGNIRSQIDCTTTHAFCVQTLGHMCMASSANVRQRCMFVDIIFNNAMYTGYCTQQQEGGAHTTLHVSLKGSNKIQPANWVTFGQSRRSVQASFQLGCSALLHPSRIAAQLRFVEGIASHKMAFTWHCPRT